MSDVSQWNVAAASNNATPPDGAPESTTTIPQLNDIIREMMAAAKRWYVHQNSSLVTAGSGNAYTLTTGSSHAALTDLPLLVFRANRANTGAATLNVDTLGAKDMTIKGAQALESGNITEDQMVAAIYNPDQDRFELTLLGAAVAAADLSASALGFTLINGSLQASVDSNVLTIAVKTLAGSDPSAADPVYALFRSSTLTSGGFTVRTINAALSLDVPDGADLGTSDSTPFRYWITLHDDNGTVRLGVSNRRLSTGISTINEAAKSTTTAISSGADSAGTYYTGTAISTAAPLQVAGYLEYDTGLATAGTYNNPPDLVHLRTAGMKLPGDIVQTHIDTKTDTDSTNGSTDASFADISGLSLDMPVTSAANQVLVAACISVSGGSNVRRVGVKLVRGSTDIGIGAAAGNRFRAGGGAAITTSAWVEDVTLRALDSPGATGSVTYKVQYRSDTDTGVVYINRSGQDTDNSAHPRTASTITAQEIMG